METKTDKRGRRARNPHLVTVVRALKPQRVHLVVGDGAERRRFPERLEREPRKREE